MWIWGAKYPYRPLEEVVGHTYDYIIVGGGTAGSAIAARLSESQGVTVLLLEKGLYHQGIQSRIPLASVAQGNYIVRHKSEPEAHMGNREAEILSAQTLGGNSMINAMIYTRGAPSYYESWAERFPDWSWPRTKPYFEKTETVVSLHQTSDLQSNIYPFLQESAKALGLPDKPHASTVGHFNLDLTIDPQGYRHSAFHAYLSKEVAIQRQAFLHICFEAAVSRLELDISHGIVSGVFVEHAASVLQDSQGERRVSLIKARREVILTSGALGSPQLLQLSGIGPRSLLQKHNIPVARDLPGVGSNLSDHNLIPVFVQVPAEDTLQQLQDSTFQMIKQALLYFTTGKGWLQSAVDRAIFLNTSKFNLESGTMDDDGTGTPSRNAANIPDVEIMILPVGTLPDVYPGKSLFTLQTCLTQPKSTGCVEIKSSNSQDRPRIQLNMLSDVDDQQVARKALRFSLCLAEYFVHRSGYPQASNVFGAPGGADKPAWKEGDWRSVSDYDLDLYIEKYISPSFHLTSSCRMAAEDEGGVVNSQLLVHGFKNLRIADASVLPSVAPAHPMATVYMVAERCAEFVKDAWSQTHVA